MARVELKNIRKEWDSAVAVAGLDLAVADGEFVAILGPSGCGKSTTLFMLAGIYMPTAGDILFDGARVNDVEARDRNVGIVFQSYALYPNMTVAKNIMFPLRFQHLAQGEAEARMTRAAELVRVGELLGRRPSQLSGGQQQRVALARALVKEPRLLLLDEPLSNLDATLRHSMRTEIRRIQRQFGVTTLLVTHDQVEASTMADRIIVMNNGRIEQVGTPHEIYAEPASRFVAGFVGSPPTNIVDLSDCQAHVHLSGAGSEKAAAAIGIRPEHIAFAGAGLPGRVAGIEPQGRETLALVETPIGPVRVLQPGTLAVREDEAVHLAWSADQSIVFAGDGRRLAGAHAHAPAL